jgi:hypothetical protein
MSKQTFTTGQILTAAQMTTLQANDYNQTVSAKTANYTLVAADAGTRITMSNAGATTITVNTSLFTAGDTLTITNIGAGVTTITAGTATVSTATSLALNQYDSGTLYFSSTSAAIWTGVSNPGDITAVNTAVTSGLTGGATSGAVDLSLLLNFNAQTGTTYTLVSTDLNKLVTTSNASAVTVTVPPSVFSAGQQINVQSIGVGLTSFAQGAGVTITSTGATSTAPVLRARYSAATIICTAANTFTIIGDLS